MLVYGRDGNTPGAVTVKIQGASGPVDIRGELVAAIYPVLDGVVGDGRRTGIPCQDNLLGLGRFPGLAPREYQRGTRRSQN